MSCGGARDCADCGFLFLFIFAVGGDGERLFLYGVVVGGGGLHEEALEDCAEGVHLFGVLR